MLLFVKLLVDLLSVTCVSRRMLCWLLLRGILLAKSNWKGRDSSVGIATGYGLDGPEIESRCGRNFLHPPRPALRPTQPTVQWVPGLSQGSSGRGVALTTHPHLALRLRKEYSYTSTHPLGLRGLFYLYI